MTDYTPLSRFRKFISRVSALATEFGNQLSLRGFKTGGTAGQVPRKSGSGNFLWSWANLGWNDITGKPTTFPPSAHTHPISQVTGLQTALDGKASKWTPIVTKTANYTITIEDDVVLVDTTSGPLTISLPVAANCNGLSVLVKKISSDVNSVTIDGNGTETIDGELTEMLAVQWQLVRMKSNGTAWFIVGEFTP